MKRELLKAYHYTVLFFENTETTGNAADYVLDILPAGASAVREEVRRVAALYGCDHIRSSFNEESYYIFKNADNALSALIAAEKAEQEPEPTPEPEPQEEQEETLPEDDLQAGSPSAILARDAMRFFFDDDPWNGMTEEEMTEALYDSIQEDPASIIDDIRDIIDTDDKLRQRGEALIARLSAIAENN